MEIPGSLWRQMVDHARAEAPREAVGLIGGKRDGRMQYLYPLPNIAGPQAFFADPYAQYQAERCLGGHDAVPIGYYHSHPGGGLDLSEADRHFACRPDWVYVVVATGWHGEGTAHAAAYRLFSGELRQVSVVLVEDSKLRDTSPL